MYNFNIITRKTQEEIDNALEQNKHLMIIYIARWSDRSYYLFNTLKDTYKDVYKTIYVDADESLELMENMDVYRVPTVQFYNNKKLVTTLKDNITKEEIIEAVSNRA